MAGDIGKAYVQIIPTTKGIKGKLEEEIGGNSSGIGSKLGSNLASGIKKGLKVGLAGIGAGLLGSIKLGADLEQQLGGAEAVFEKFSSKLVKTSKTAFKEMGLSQNSFLQGANKMGSLFQGSGHSIQKSMEMSMNYMHRASDVASIMGIDTEEALNAVNAAAKGNFTMMDNLGVAMNATTLEAYALSKGIKKSWNSMSMQEKTGLAYQMFMEKTAKYAGNYAKENDTLSGSLNTLKTGFSTLLAQLAQGEDVSVTLDGLKETAKQFMTSLTESLKNISAQLPSIISELAPAFNELINTFIPMLIPIVTQAFTTIFTAIASNLPGLISSLIGQIPAIGSALVDAFASADIGGKIGLAIVGGFAAFNIVSKIKPIISTLTGALGAIKIPAMPAGGGAGFGAFMTSLANGLKAFANPQILLGAAIIAGAMAILSVGVWASIKIISDSLPDLGEALGSFNEIDGGNLAKVGLGLVALGAGLLALTAGKIVDGLAKWLGFGDFGDTLKSIIEPIAEILPTIDASQLEKFSLLSNGLATLATGFEGIKDLGTIGKGIADGITQIKDAVAKFAEIEVESMQGVTTILTSISTAMAGFSNINGENLGLIGTGLTNLSEGVKTLSTMNPEVVAQVGESIKSLIEPLAQAMSSISAETITMFSTLATALMNLGKAGEGIRTLGSAGDSASSAIDKIKVAVQNAVAIGIEPYSQLSSQFAALKTALAQLSSVKLNPGPIVNFLTNVSNKIKTLNNFSWSAAVAKMKTQGQGIGKGVVQGIVSGINSEAYTLNIAISDKIDDMVAAAVKKAQIHSPSRLFRDKVGYWIGAGIGVGVDSGIDDYMPDSIATIKSGLSGYELDHSSNQVAFPNELKIIDGDGIMMRVKPVINEKIIRNNINNGII